MATTAQVRSRTRDAFDSSGTNRWIDIAALGAQPGDQLFVCFTNDHATNTASTSSTGWQRLATRQQGSTTNHRSSIFWKRADGDDDLLITTSESQQATYIAICVEGGGDPPHIAVADFGDDNNTAELEPLSGLPLGDYLSILFCAVDTYPNGPDVFVTPPAGYGNLESQRPGVTSSAATFSMEATLAGRTSISPGPITLSRNEQWITFNVAIPPTPFTVVEGTATATLGGLTATATGTRIVDGTATVPLGGLTATADGTVEPVDHAAAGIGDVAVEGLPVELTRYLPPPVVGGVEVEGLPIRVAHVVPVEPLDVEVTALPGEMLSTQLRAADVEVEGLPIQVSYGSRHIGGRGGLVAVPPAPTTRFIVQSILTGEYLHWDLPLADPTITFELSGPTSITGRLRPEDPGLVDLIETGMEPWSCWVHVETDGLVRASAILQPYQLDGEEYVLEAVGVSAYPHGMPYLGELSAIAIDPADIVREIWGHLQSYPDAPLGVTVLGSTPVRIGEPEPEEGVEYEEGERPAGPYKLSWWEGTDCGSEIDNLAREVGFDFVERCEWLPDRSGVKHWIELAYPRIGTRRDDLRFATGENIIGNPIPAEETDDLYASQVVMFGKGEGRDTVRGYAGRSLRSRLRRVAVIQDRTVDRVERANAIAKADLERRQGLLDITDIEVDARHINARFGSYQVGDDILIDVEIPWQGRLQQYERILSITYSPDAESVRLQLRRADAGWYGGQTA